jgi:hypothetical protein
MARIGVPLLLLTALFEFRDSVTGARERFGKPEGHYVTTVVALSGAVE